LFLPLGGETERQWDVRLKLLLYFVGLVYSFLGVSIVADIFMAAIERITSLQKKVKVPGTNRMVTVQVWNETVANLTLMALGSSAPEILLALNDVLKNRFFEGSLGPSTIVGSAAFNLFCIIAVCINSIPNGEVRMIKETSGTVITFLACCSNLSQAFPRTLAPVVSAKVGFDATVMFFLATAAAALMASAHPLRHLANPYDKGWTSAKED